jgi:GTPase SAR1 family protein
MSTHIATSNPKTNGGSSGRTDRSKTEQVSSPAKRLYRFALFGLSGSGKTCYLTALGTDCRSTREAATCTALPPLDTDSVAIKHGWLALSENITALKKRTLPKATPPSNDVPQYRFSYSDAQIGKLNFEILDYAGELLRLDSLVSGDELAKSIRAKMRDLDGFIVLAVTPPKGATDSEIPNELNALVQAFNQDKTASKNERKTPIALVLTKWDRQSAIPENSEQGERENFAIFLKNNPSFGNVQNDLRNDVGADNFCTFPLSALGHCDSTDIPLEVNPLQSYGVPFPFGWLARRINEMDAQRAKELIEKLPALYYPAIPFKSMPETDILHIARTIRNRTEDLRKRAAQDLQKGKTSHEKIISPEISAAVASIPQISKRKFLRILTSGLEYLATAMLIGILAWGFCDNSRFKEIQTQASAPDTAPSILLDSREWLEHYVNSSFFSPRTLFRSSLIVSYTKANDLLEDIRTRTEEVDYKRIIDTTIDRKTIELAEEFVSRYPNSKHRAGVIKRIDSANRAIATMKNVSALTQLENLAKNAHSIEALNAVINEAEKQNFFPEVKYSDTVEPERLRILNDAHSRRAALVAAAEWDKFEKIVREKFNEEKFAPAINSLSERELKNSKWKEFAEEILSATLQKIKTKKDNVEFQNKFKFSDVRDAAKKLANSEIDTEALVRELHLFERFAHAQKDKSLYEVVRNDRTVDSCIAYLENGTGAMNSYVERYKNYLNELNGQLEISVRAEIEWREGCHGFSGKLWTNNRNEVNIHVGAEKVYNGEIQTIEDGGRSFVKTFSIKGNLSDSKKIECKIIFLNWITRNNNGEGGQDVTIGSLRRGVTIDLPADGFANRLHLSYAGGLPDEPPLPEWEGQKINDHKH